MPLAEIAERNIIMTNVRGIHKTPMAESVLAHILALRRSLPLIYERQKTKEWSRQVGSTELKRIHRTDTWSWCNWFRNR